MTNQEIENIYSIRKTMSHLSTADMTERLLEQMVQTRNNQEFLEIMTKLLKKD